MTEGQGHPDLNRNVAYSYLYHNTQFERSLSVNVRIKASVKNAYLFPNEITKAGFSTWNIDQMRYNGYENQTNKSQQNTKFNLNRLKTLLSRIPVTFNEC